MKITSSYGVRLLGMNKMLYATNHIYQDAVCYLTDCVNEMWDTVSVIKGSNDRMTYVERKVHAAGSRIPDYPFDERFPNMPSYMRRDAIHAAIGNVSSYRSNYVNWQKAGSHGRALYVRLWCNSIDWPEISMHGQLKYYWGKSAKEARSPIQIP